jgi:hypothetical protein
MSNNSMTKPEKIPVDREWSLVMRVLESFLQTSFSPGHEISPARNIQQASSLFPLRHSHLPDEPKTFVHHRIANQNCNAAQFPSSRQNLILRRTTTTSLLALYFPFHLNTKHICTNLFSTRATISFAFHVQPPLSLTNSIWSPKYAQAGSSGVLSCDDVGSGPSGRC